jgi:signal peptidase II
VTAFITAAALVLAADALSKWAAIRMLSEGRIYAVVPGWGLRRIANDAGRLSTAQAAALLAVVVGLILAVAPQAPTAAGLGLAVGGAAGNLVDRFRRGFVVDFVAAGAWPVFNLADAAMTLGLVVAAVGVL